MHHLATLVETHADPKRGPSLELLAALAAGYTPGPSWLVTKEDGSQAIVVVCWRHEQNPPPPVDLSGGKAPAWIPWAVGGMVAAAVMVGGIVGLVLLLRA